NPAAVLRRLAPAQNAQTEKRDAEERQRSGFGHVIARLRHRRLEAATAADLDDAVGALSRAVRKARAVLRDVPAAIRADLGEIAAETAVREERHGIVVIGV